MPCLGSFRLARSEDDGYRTSHKSNTHSTDSREVLYPWHPLVWSRGLDFSDASEPRANGRPLWLETNLDVVLGSPRFRLEIEAALGRRAHRGKAGRKSGTDHV